MVPEAEGGGRDGSVRRAGSCDGMRGSLSRTGAGRLQGDAGSSGFSSSVRAECGPGPGRATGLHWPVVSVETVFQPLILDEMPKEEWPQHPGSGEQVPGRAGDVGEGGAAGPGATSWAQGAPCRRACGPGGSRSQARTPGAHSSGPSWRQMGWFPCLKTGCSQWLWEAFQTVCPFVVNCEMVPGLPRTQTGRQTTVTDQSGLVSVLIPLLTPVCPGARCLIFLGFSSVIYKTEIIIFNCQTC